MPIYKLVILSTSEDIMVSHSLITPESRIKEVPSLQPGIAYEWADIKDGFLTKEDFYFKI